MYRLLEKSGQPTNQQTPGKSIRQLSGPEKGRPAGKFATGAVDYTTGHHLLGGQ